MAYILRMPLARSSFCTGLKKLQKASQVFGASDSLKPAFVDQVAPDMERRGRLLDRSKVEGALLRGAVVEGGVQQRGLAELGLVRLHDVAHVHQLVVPGVLRQDRCRCVMENQVRDLPAGDRGYRLLVQRLERHDAEVDLVAGGLLVVGDRLAERRVLLRDEALYLPDGRGLGRPHWRCRDAPRRPLPPDPAIHELPNAGSCCSWPFSFPDVRTRSFRYLVMAALSAFLTSSVWQLAGRGQLIAALGGGMDVAYERRRKGFTRRAPRTHGRH